MSPSYRDIARIVNGQYGITNHEPTVVLHSDTVLFVKKSRVVQVRLLIGTRKFAEITNPILYLIVNFEFWGGAISAVASGKYSSRFTAGVILSNL